MSNATIGLDQKRYGRLLAETKPAIIKSEEENDRLLACIEGLMGKGENNLTTAEATLLELLRLKVGPNGCRPEWLLRVAT